MATNGLFTQRCEAWLSEECNGSALLVPSCTSALEASVLLANVGPGDEVILPSFAYPTCASSIIRSGATPVFVDIDPETLSITSEHVERARTRHTKAVMPVWYAGVQGRLETDLRVLEDGAQCIGNFKLNGFSGSISFHSSKNVGCGEGGALIVQKHDEERARTICSSGTGRWKDKSKWDWDVIGSSFLMAEPLAEILWEDLRRTQTINEKRLKVWKVYHDNLPEPKAQTPGNAHLFWFLTEKRDELMSQVPGLVKHYSALHERPMGIRYGRAGNMRWTDHVVPRLVRPPMNVSEDEAFSICERIKEIL